MQIRRLGQSARLIVHLQKRLPDHTPLRITALLFLDLLSFLENGLAGLFLLHIEFELLLLFVIQRLLRVQLLEHLLFELIQFLHFLHIGSVVLAKVLVVGGLGILDDDNLLEQFLLLEVQLLLLLELELFHGVAEVDLEHLLAMLDDVLLFFLGTFDLLLELSDLCVLFPLLLRFLVQLLLKVFGFFL